MGWSSRISRLPPWPSWGPGRGLWREIKTYCEAVLRLSYFHAFCFAYCVIFFKLSRADLNGGHVVHMPGCSCRCCSSCSCFLLCCVCLCGANIWWDVQVLSGCVCAGWATCTSWSWEWVGQVILHHYQHKYHTEKPQWSLCHKRDKRYFKAFKKMLRVGWFFLVILPGPTDGGVYEITYPMPEDTESSKHGEQNILIRTSKSLRLNRHHWQPGCHHLGMRSVCPKHDYPFTPVPLIPLPFTYWQ